MILARAALAAALAAAAAGAPTAGAQQPPAGQDSPISRRPLILHAPAELDPAPAALRPPAVKPPPDRDCAPAWPCRLQLFGGISKYGGVGLKGPALSW
jgi:hypothetical protein